MMMFSARKIIQYKYEFIDPSMMLREGLCSIEKNANGWEPLAPPSPTGKGWLMVWVKYEEEK